VILDKLHTIIPVDLDATGADAVAAASLLLLSQG
jgi:hypothetical protein